MVHKKLLISHSKFFQDKLKMNSDLDEVTSVRLEKDDPAAVALMITFLYRGVVPCWQGNKPTHTASTMNFTFPATEIEKSGFGVLAQRPLTSRSGTAFTPFQAFVEKEPNSSTNQENAFQNICFQEPYQKFSFEELRLEDYRFGLRFSQASAATITTPPKFEKQPTSSPFARLGTPSTLSFSQPTSSSSAGPLLLKPASGSTAGFSFSPAPAFGSPQTQNIPENDVNFGKLAQATPGLFGGTGGTPNSGSSSALFRGGFGSASSSSSTPSKIFGAPPTSPVSSSAASLSGQPAAAKAPINSNLKAQAPAIDPREAHSLALLNLCILAERIAWPDLFNIAVKIYITDIASPGMPTPVSHIETIYRRTKVGSPLRTFAIDCVSRFGANNFLSLAQENKEFLSDIWGIMRPSTENSSVLFAVTYGKYNLKSSSTNTEGRSE